MGEWFETLSGLEQTLFLIAVFSTTIFAVQLLATITGMGGDDADLEAVADGSPMDFGDIFTIRNGVSFLMGFSWGGLMAFDWGLEHESFAIIVGFFVGSFFVAVNVALLLALSRLRNAGNIQLDNAVDSEGIVSLAIPGQRGGAGKVTITIQGRIKEYHALTDGDSLPKNTPVTVLDVLGSQLIVGKAVS